MSCEDLFLKRLRQRGFRLTPQRELVLSVLHQVGQPSTAEDIYERVAQQSPSVELSTVYRTLDLMVDMHIVTLIAGGGEKQQRLFELQGAESDHLHLVCRRCGKIIGVALEDAQPLVRAVQARAQFTLDLNNLTIPGLCADCARAEEAETGAR
mgnify:CR=1 FL=1